MNEEQIQKLVKEEGFPEPKFKVGDMVQHMFRDEPSRIEKIEVDDKWFNDYGVRGWVYLSSMEIESPWWGRDDDLELV